VGYSVVWQNGQRWVGLKTHVGYNQEAYDAERAALENCRKAADNSGEGHDLYGRPGCHQAHGLGGS